MRVRPTFTGGGDQGLQLEPKQTFPDSTRGLSSYIAKRLMGFVLVLLAWIAGFSVAADAQQAATSSTTKIAVQVVDPATEEGKLLAKTQELHAASPVVHVAISTNLSPIQVLTNSLIVLHGSRRARFSVEHPEVLAEPTGMYVFPSDVQGILQAKKPGNAVIAVAYLEAAPECGGVAAGCTPNWAGYVLKVPETTYTGVTAQWTVPAIASNSPHGNSCTWVGMGGLNTGTLIQAGTEQDSHPWYEPSSSPIYFAWYELFPSLQKFITPFAGLGRALGSATSNTIEAGDVVQVSITPALGFPTPVAGQKNQFVIQFTDLTRNWSYSTTEGYTGDLSSAEWIEEATTELDGVSNLPDYQQVEFDFDDKVATFGGALGPPNLVAADSLAMNQGGANGVYSTPSNPSGDGSGFYVTWTEGSPNKVFPPGPWIQTTSLPPAQVNEPYSQSLLVNQAATPNWTLVGALPLGLTLNRSQGTITGTPTTLGTFQFNVFATDTSTGAATSQQGLTIAVLADPAASLQVDCGSVVPPVGGVTVGVAVDGVPLACYVPRILPLGIHTVVGTVSGSTKPYVISYMGACNASGQVSLTSGTVAMCTISAVALGTKEGACPGVGQHCCEPSANGCLKCVSNKLSCN